MPYELTEKEALRVEAFDRNQRLDHFLEKADKEDEIWTIAEGDGIAVLGAEEEGGEFVPLWPHPEYASAWIAEAFGDQDLSTLELAAIPKDLMRSEVLPEFRDAGIQLLVFPTTEDDGDMLSAEALATKMGGFLAREEAA